MLDLYREGRALLRASDAEDEERFEQDRLDRERDYAPAHRCDPRSTPSKIPQTGDAAATTVEARGTCSPARDSRRERNPSYDAARAAGAQVTGQRQDGPSQVPVREQYPRAAHGGAGPTSSQGGLTGRDDPKDQPGGGR